MDFLDELKQDADRVLSDNKGNADYLEKFVQFPEEDGAITVRILPPSHGMKLPFQATRIHNVNGKSLHCPYELVGGKWVGQPGQCPVCDVYRHLWKLANKSSGDKAKGYIALARKIKPIERYYFNCVVREDPSQIGVKVLSMGKTLYKMILRAFVGDKKLKRKPLGNICDTTGKEGRDFTSVKEMVQSGRESFPKYEQSSFEQPSPLADPQEVEKILEKCYDLSELRTIKEFDVLDHNLQVELGNKSDDESGFDPRKYNLDGGSTAPTLDSAPEETPTVKTVETVVTTVENPVQTPPATAPADSAEEEEEVMADVDFMKELEDM
jgi:hypothetical protein